MSEARRERRARLNAIIKEVDSLIAQRTVLADGFLVDMKMTAEMVNELDKGIYLDKEFQKHWDRFQELSRRIDGLRETGAKMVELKTKNRLSGGAFMEGIKASLEGKMKKNS